MRGDATYRGPIRKRISSGQALVEFTLIVPVFFLVFFGIVEFALITASMGTFDFATREAARAASILGRNTTADTVTVTALTSHIQSIVMAKVTEVDIYRADPLTGQCLPPLPASSPDAPPGIASATATPPAIPACAEDVYQPPFTSPITCNPSPCGYSPNARNDALANADYVGVRVAYQYTFVTGFVAGLGSTLNLQTYSVQRIEPQDYNTALRRGTPDAPSMQASASWVGATTTPGRTPIWKRGQPLTMGEGGAA